MYVKVDRTRKYISVDDSYATLLSVTDDELKFDVRYNADFPAMVRLGSTEVRVSVHSRSTTPVFSDKTTTALGSIDDLEEARGTSLRKSLAADQTHGYRLTSTRTDVMSKVNNEVIPQLLQSTKPSDIAQLRKSKLKSASASNFKKRAEPVPVIERQMTLQPEISGSIRYLNDSKLMLDMMLKSNRDPSTVVSLSTNAASAFELSSGLVGKRANPVVQFSSDSKLLGRRSLPDGISFPRTSNDLSDSSELSEYTTSVTDEAEVNCTLSIPKRSLRLESSVHSELEVHFDLIQKKTGLQLQRIVKSLDVAEHLRHWYVPKIPPTVSVGRSEQRNRANLQIKQLDPMASAVKVYRKVIGKTVQTLEQYEFMGTFNVKSDQQTLLVPVDIPRESTYVYRVIPTTPDGAHGHVYTNALINPAKPKLISRLSLTCQSTEVGVKLEARSIPSHVAAIRFLVRDLTIRESSFRNVGNDTLLLDDQVRSVGLASVVDTEVTGGHVYEYAAVMIFDGGETKQSETALVEFLSPEKGKVETTIRDFVLTNGAERDVSFTVRTTVSESELDGVKKMLTEQGLADLFSSEIESERDLLQSLVAHNIHRVNLSTGEREDFGVLTSGRFSDSELRANSSVKPLAAGHSYRYDVIPLLRAPETMFDKLSKQSIDHVTKKPYSFKPSKFLHPVTLKSGTLVSPAGLRSIHAKDAMMHGAIGNVKTVEASFAGSRSTLLNASVQTFDRRTNVLTCTIDHAGDEIDHVIVMKEVHGRRTLLAALATFIEASTVTWYHELSSSDVGSMRYIMMPVYGDYSVGAEISSNFIVVEATPRDLKR